MRGISLSKTYSAKFLFDTAVKWLRENDGKPLPKDGHLGVEHNAAFHSSSAYYLSPSNGNRLENIPGRLIPVLAGISLGLDSQTVARIINDHGAKIWDVTSLSLSNLDLAPIPLLKEGLAQASSAKIFIEVVKAFDTCAAMRVELLDNKVSSPGALMALAYTHAEFQDLWPTAAIRQHADYIMTPSEGKVRDRAPRFEGLIAAPKAVTDLPHGDALVLMRRVGMFDDVVSRKLTGRFAFWEKMASLAAQGHAQQIKMMEAVRDCDDRETLALALKGFLGSASDATTSDYEGDRVLQFTQDFFRGNEHFRPLLESTIYKLNTISLVDYLDDLARMEHRSELYSDILNHRGTLVSRVAHEILSRPANELGYADYLALSKLARLKLPKQEISFDPARLISHVLDSIATYLTPNEVLCREKLKMDEVARESIIALGSLTSRLGALDYSGLQRHTEDDKVLLITGGLDVRRFTGLSRASKAAVLEHEMGL